MRNSFIIGGICLVLIAIGAWLYLHEGTTITPGEPTSSTANATTDVPAEHIVDFSVLGSGASATGVPIRKNYAIYDPGEFATYWKKARGENAVVPKVDFKNSYVIAVFAGEKPTGGYKISISKIADSGSARNVSVLISLPGKGCITSEAITSPYQFVKVPLMNAPALSHTDLTETKDCQ